MLMKSKREGGSPGRRRGLEGWVFGVRRPARQRAQEQEQGPDEEEAARHPLINAALSETVHW